MTIWFIIVLGSMRAQIWFAVASLLMSLTVERNLRATRLQRF